MRKAVGVIPWRNTLSVLPLAIRCPYCLWQYAVRIAFGNTKNRRSEVILCHLPLRRDFRLAQRDVCACSHGIRVDALTASARRSGQGRLRARPDPPACRRGRLWRRRCPWVWRPSAYRRDSPFVGQNAQRWFRSLFVAIKHRRQSLVTFYWTEHDPPQTLKCHEGRA